MPFGDLFRVYGIPDHAWLDNGRGFAAKCITGGTPNRFRFKVKPEEPSGILTALGIDIREACRAAMEAEGYSQADVSRLAGIAYGTLLAGPIDVVPLAPLDAVLLLTVAGHRLATEEILMEALWPDPDDMPDYWADQIKVRVCALRKSLKQVGAAEEIINEWGRGFYLRRANK